MPSNPCIGTLISDFNVETFRRYLVNDPAWPPVSATTGPYGQVVPALVDSTLECWSQEPDFAVVWTRPESVALSVGRALEFRPVRSEDLIGEVDRFAELLEGLAHRVRTVIVPTWTSALYGRGAGILDARPGIGIGDTINRMNLRLVDRTSGNRGLYFVDTNLWIARSTAQACDPAPWYMAKVPFDNSVLTCAVAETKAVLRAVAGKNRKLLLVDLDDTLWGGIVGDVGIDRLRLGGHDPLGEAFADFQRAVKALTNRGVLLGIISKNDEELALTAIAKHPEMVLSLDDFVGWRINWDDKAKNVVDLVTALGLSLDSVVFIDDNPVERARVAEALPDVLVPEWPVSKLHYARSLRMLDCFDAVSITAEDRRRTDLYAEEEGRSRSHEQIGSLESWLQRLSTRVCAEVLHDANLQRTAQLLNKTNQMNLTLRRLAESELVDWAARPGHVMYTFRVSDTFGDSGLTGVLGLECADGDVRIVDFVLSCRVMGRLIEETMLHVAIRFAQDIGASRVVATYLPGPRNQPCKAFFDRSGLRTDGDHYAWILGSNSYPLPRAIQLIDSADEPDSKDNGVVVGSGQRVGRVTD